jgi:hypothetical protein
MRLSARMIATAAFAFFLMSAFNLCAEDAAKASGSDAKALDSSAAEPGAPMFFVPMRESSMGAALPYSGGPDIGVPRYELFLGYSYLQAVPKLAAGNRLVWLNGGSASVAFNVNRHLGLVADFGAYTNSQMQFTGAYTSTVNVNNSNVAVLTYLFGPRLSFRKYDRITPFAQVLFGGVRANQVILTGCTSNCTLLPAQDSFSMTAGSGLDLRIHRHFAIRMIQAEYLMTRFASYTTGTTGTQNDMRLSAGIVFRMNGNPAPQSVALACSASPAAIFPGDPVTVTATAGNLDPKLNVVYTWAGVPGLNGNGTTASLDSAATAALAPGSYTVNCGVKEGRPGKEGLRPWESAASTAGFTVKAFEPPTISCTASPLTIAPGGTATVTSVGVSPQNLPLTYSYTTTAGTVSGSGTTAEYSSAGAATGAVGITCNVQDNKGHSASANTSLTIVPLIIPPPPKTQALCTISLSTDKKRPMRVDNEAKACLDQVALDLKQQADAKAVVVGEQTTDEAAVTAKEQQRALKHKHATVDMFAAQRAVNAKDYLVTEQGIDASRISVATGSTDGETVENYLVPSGATFSNDVTGTTPVDETAVKPQVRKPLAERHPMKK